MPAKKKNSSWEKKWKKLNKITIAKTFEAFSLKAKFDQIKYTQIPKYTPWKSFDGQKIAKEMTKTKKIIILRNFLN